MKHLIATCSYLLFFGIIFIGCKEKKNEKNLYSVRTDIRLGSKFYSIYFNEIGDAYAIKGNCSYYTEPLKVESSDTSSLFKLDSVKPFFVKLDAIKINPIIGGNREGAPRVEIYYGNKKIYDACKWDEPFWDLFRPIMEQIPKGFNPFLSDDKPFE
jgi:hypothetical protein